MSERDDENENENESTRQTVDRSDTVAPTVLGDVLSSTLARVQASLGSPSSEANPLPGLVGSILTRLAAAQKPPPPLPAVVDLEQERARRRPAAVAALDVRALVDEAVEAFARSQLADAPEAPHLVVVIDGEYLARHGEELVPAILAHVAQGYVALLSGQPSPAPPRRDSGDEAAATIEIAYDFGDIVRALLAQPQRG